MKVAKELGRHYVGYEIVPAYGDTIAAKLDAKPSNRRRYAKK